MTEPSHPPEGFVQAVIRRRRFAPIWLVPIVAASISVYLAVAYLADRGPLITITFKSADGITAQQTEVKHKAVSLGLVEDVRLSKDMTHVVVHVRMNRQGAAILTDHAHFWVVRPRLTPGSISGLETLVSGAYIEVDPGDAGGALVNSFTGLEDPPGVRSDEPGTTFVLNAARLGSLGPGAPVFFRDVTVGEVLSYDLGETMALAKIKVFVRQPYDRFVHENTHFWNTSGLSVSFGSQGIHFELESLQALLSGGVAFETPRNMGDERPAPANAVFHLYDTAADADAAGFARNIPFVTYFTSSVSGLGRGSAVAVFGLQIGTVTDVRLIMDPTLGRMRARVAFDLQPERVFSEDEVRRQPDPAHVTAALVRNGMRAVLESSNFITGQKAISLQYVPAAAPASVGYEGDALVLPSQAGGLDNVTTAISDIASKLDAIPFDEIGRSLANTLHGADRTINGPDLQAAIHDLAGTLAAIHELAQHANQGLAPVMRKLPHLSDELQQSVERANAILGEGGYGANSDFQRDMARLLDEAGEAARSVRLLTDYLERHPEALIKGRGKGVGER